eukprot:TRINITY_DN17075_c0_g1_i1.p1 TRINITY_DN17075_c0_g1~~TRINITY_DN17075_c0_g1_i1.p1  ORF type:complete len:162 (+),score=6.62 TRINITY_DN17075_c0_g1_i1:51-488(+)
MAQCQYHMHKLRACTVMTAFMLVTRALASTLPDSNAPVRILIFCQNLYYANSAYTARARRSGSSPWHAHLSKDSSLSEQADEVTDKCRHELATFSKARDDAHKKKLSDNTCQLRSASVCSAHHTCALHVLGLGLVLGDQARVAHA